MIGLILGTSEGKKIVSLLNEFTDDLFITTATSYGGELLKDYKYKILNTSPLDLKGIIDTINEKNIKILVDASHPYALEVTQNAVEACSKCGIEYVRYDRPSILEKYIGNDSVKIVKDYNELKTELIKIKGNILNTTGSRNIEKILSFNLENRIIHRVLPSLKVFNELDKISVKPEEIIAIKGPVSYDLNLSFIKEYNAKAIIMKDSGVQGGTDEKITAVIDSGITAFVIGRNKMKYDNVFNSEEKLVQYIKNRIL